MRNDTAADVALQHAMERLEVTMLGVRGIRESDQADLDDLVVKYLSRFGGEEVQP